MSANLRFAGRVILACFTGWAAFAAAPPMEQAGNSEENPIEELRTSVRRLARSHSLTENQSDRMRHVLENLTRSAEMFRSQGVLSPAVVVEKVSALAEVARNEVVAVLDADQLRAWKHWEGAKAVPAAENLGRPTGRKQASDPPDS